jgi:hypothetical protein
MTVVNRLPFLAVALVLVAVALVATASAASPQAWYWSKERAERVAFVEDVPEGCVAAIERDGAKSPPQPSRWSGDCDAPAYFVNHGPGGQFYADDAPTCVGIGPRIISSTNDVYLYRTFSCSFPSMGWTTKDLEAAAKKACPGYVSGTSASGFAATVCESAAGAAVRYGTSALRVQVTGRFTATATWHGVVWNERVPVTG